MIEKILVIYALKNNLHAKNSLALSEQKFYSDD